MSLLSFVEHATRKRLGIIVSAASLVVSVTFLATVGLSQSNPSNTQFTQGSVNDSATLSLGVPLANYKGRGLDLPISLNYSSSVWRIDHVADVNDYTTVYNPYPVKRSVTQAIYSEYAASGWRSTLDLPQIEWPKASEIYAYDGKAVPSGWNYRIAKVFIHMPDGSIHEFRKSDTPQTLGYVDTSGSFYAVDSSRMRYDSTDSDTGTLYMPDGTQYVLDAGSGQIVDRNGNTMTYSASTRQWTDTLGRVIANPLPATPTVGTYTYTLPGLSSVNSGEQDYTFKWELLADSLTPDEYSQTPDLRYAASHYLPTPANPPTSSNSSNFPHAQPTTHDYLFNSEAPYNAEEESFTTFVVGKDQAGDTVFNPVVLTEITLPDGSKYKFSYDVYGEVDKVMYPTGAYEQYAFVTPTGESVRQPYNRAERRVTSRKLSVDGSGGDIEEWKYEESIYGGYGVLDGIGTYTITSVIAPDKTRSEVYKWNIENGVNLFGYTDARKGVVVQKKFFSTSTDGHGGDLLRRELTEFEQTSNPIYYTASCGSGTCHTWIYPYRNPRPVKTVSILFEGSGSALGQTTTYTYGSGNGMTIGLDQTQSSVYNYAVISNTSTSDYAQGHSIGDITTGSLARTTETTYSTSTDYLTANILGVPTVVKIKDSSGNVVSQSEMVYDESGYAPASTHRALPTSMRTWDSTKGVSTNTSAYLVTHATFDTYGNRTVATDAKGFATTTTYDSTYHTFPISVTTPVPDSTGTYGSSTAFTASTSYDATTGLVMSATDINGQTTTMEYDDALLRPTKVTAPNGQQTTTEYGAGTSSSTRWVKVRSQIDSTNWAEATSTYDGLGRTFQTKKVDGEGDVYSNAEFDTMGRVKRSTNPYKSGETQKWTTPEYDDLSRTKKVTSPDSVDVTIAFGLSISGAVGTSKTITDQSGHTRTGITDALGNMIQVIEDPTGSPLTTVYTFDTLGNLRKTAQGSQNRYFMYDSLGRVLYARQVEQDANSNFSGSTYADPITSNNQWSVKYTYDDNGNIATTTDARNKTITATYDQLNRLKVRDYSDSSMPDVSVYYDGKGLDSVPSYSKGKTTKVANSLSESRNTSFDTMGRILSSEQFTSGMTLTTSYTYNLAGALLEETYPSGRVVRNNLNADGELASVESKSNSLSSYSTYANNFTHNSAGAVTKMQLGNSRWETATYNDRLQITQIALGTTDTNKNLLELDYEYTGANPSTTVADRNNGSLRKQTITVPGLTNPFVQTYEYDNLNRLTSATETNNGSQTWKQEFAYDRYGNKNFVTGTGHTTTLGSCSTAVCNPTVSTSTNRLSSTGYTYDANGNLTINTMGTQFSYDAENHQTEVKDQYNNSVGQYIYDGDGKRVVKAQGNVFDLFVYDAMGRLIEEYHAVLTPPGGGGSQTGGPSAEEPSYFDNPFSLSTSYIYAGSRLLATETSSGTRYLTQDHLSSPRVITDQSGTVTDRKDFTPYGEEAIASLRTSTVGYTTAAEPRQDFTGYQKDVESNLEFAQARYYNNVHGRFTSIDRENAGELDDEPQSWNGYAYAGNNPLNVTDPTGLMWVTQNDKDFTWVDDAFFNSAEGQKQYGEGNSAGWRTANGAVSYIGSLSGTVDTEENRTLIGGYASHNKDGSLSKADDPNAGPDGEIISMGLVTTFPLVSGGSTIAEKITEIILSNPEAAGFVVGAGVGAGLSAAIATLSHGTVSPMHENSASNVAVTSLVTKNCACAPTIFMAKASKSSGKERATDIPSWAKATGVIIAAGESGAAYADRVFKAAGKAITGRGPGSEWNKIKKYGDRNK